MGVLNCTPDSFSDGGQYLDERRAIEHAVRLLERGARIIDVGAESTRPRAPRVEAHEQIARIGNVIRELADMGALVSIDTTSPEVAARALDDGAVLVNSVELAPAASLARVARERGAALALMHSRGAMSSMQDFSSAPETAYEDVIADVTRELLAARDVAVGEGLDKEDVLLDPGVGFHKNARQSLALVAHLDRIVALGHDVVVGPSRKSFLAHVAAPKGGAVAPPSDRLGATIAACLLCARKGAAVLRVHEPGEVRQALAFEEAARHV